MNIVGREKEQETLLRLYESDKPEFLVVYGRRRVGKTFLVKQFFKNNFTFYVTGVKNTKNRDQLRIFHNALKEYGSTERKAPSDWFEAFDRLEGLLKSDAAKTFGPNGRKIVFIDELPWLDSPKSSFKTALDLFWNKYGSSDERLLLIVCGSATSWIVNNILNDGGGFYNRITRKIHLMPFSLKECEELLSDNRIAFTKRQIIETYMVFGGIPYYLSLLSNNLSLAQNIDELCFGENGELRYEYDNLFSSLFSNHQKHVAVIEELARSREGLSRNELVSLTHINGGPLTTILSELEQCGFIRKYRQYGNKKNNNVFQLIDPFTLFALTYIKPNGNLRWSSYIDSGAYANWSGHAFEMVCLNHLSEIKKALGIEGLITNEFAWRSVRKNGDTQIDLVIDRKDETINLCEMKFTLTPFSIDEDYSKSLLNKAEVFKRETKCKKSIYLTMITSCGLANNDYSNDIQSKINVEQSFFNR